MKKIVKFYLEKKDNKNQSLKTLNEFYIQKFCETFGGATAYDGKGYWVSPSGEKFVEDVTVCECFVKTPLFLKRRQIKTLAKKYKHDAKQEAVSVVIDGKAYII